MSHKRSDTSLLLLDVFSFFVVDMYSRAKAKLGSKGKDDGNNAVCRKPRFSFFRGFISNFTNHQGKTHKTQPAILV